MKPAHLQPGLGPLPQQKMYNEEEDDDDDDDEDEDDDDDDNSEDEGGAVEGWVFATHTNLC